MPGGRLACEPAARVHLLGQRADDGPVEAIYTWLCPTEFDRARVLDNSTRVRRARRVAAAAIGVALIALLPRFGPWMLGLFAASAVNLLTLDRRMARSAHPELVVAFSLLFTEVLLAVGVALSGAGQSPALPWMVVPVGLTAARFRRRVMVVGGAIGLALMALATVAVDPGSVSPPTYLIAAVALMVSVVGIADALQSAELNYRSESVLDPLTGVLNRKSLALRFAELHEQARLTDGSICLIAADLDGFKQINDEHGHARGDAALRDAAYEMRKALRNFELFYRLGGEEFLVILPGVHLSAGARAAERMRDAVESSSPAGLDLTVSLGVAAASGEAAEYHALFQGADTALYRAKQLGKNRVVAIGAADVGHELGSKPVVQAPKEAVAPAR
jgi:diguanylate cyclase (GGDEF)-like protein